VTSVLRLDERTQRADRNLRPPDEDGCKTPVGNITWLAFSSNAGQNVSLCMRRSIVKYYQKWPIKRIIFFYVAYFRRTVFKNPKSLRSLRGIKSIRNNFIPVTCASIS
jgi:hypothetical protein